MHFADVGPKPISPWSTEEIKARSRERRLIAHCITQLGINQFTTTTKNKITFEGRDQRSSNFFSRTSFGVNLTKNETHRTEEQFAINLLFNKKVTAIFAPPLRAFHAPLVWESRLLDLKRGLLCFAETYKLGG